ncbi:uncharacterized protein LOC121905388 [Thunnus maccoyii]|uniref:uncharacterized protein LOC121905388 n=1 Tax=Thunnus maccoyii TaxID=8240 RepID=UPI001C4C08BE|nr:uncharacterized protein LOC121905388 [Thunnus maccoyii]
MFTTKTDSSSTVLIIICQLLTDVKCLVLYHLYKGVEVSESQDGQFAGRVQCDKDALREGRIRLHVSRIRTDDSGLYVCKVRTNSGWNTGKGRLNVTAARDWPEPETPNTASRERRPPVNSWILMKGWIICTEKWGKTLGEKMICRILLLISLTSCVCGTFVLNVTETSYQAEENHNITLELMFTTKTDSSSTVSIIICELLTDVKPLVLYHLYEGVEVSESQDGQFAGRVQCDKDALREGRIRLHVSRIRIDDSGLYQCGVRTNYGWNRGKCRLNVTAARDWPEPEIPNTVSRERIGLYCPHTGKNRQHTKSLDDAQLQLRLSCAAQVLPGVLLSVPLTTGAGKTTGVGS